MRTVCDKASKLCPESPRLSEVARCRRNWLSITSSCLWLQARRTSPVPEYILLRRARSAVSMAGPSAAMPPAMPPVWMPSASSPDQSRQLLPASSTFAIVARLFGAVAVLCKGDTCKGQRDRWPTDIGQRLQVFDADLVDSELGLDKPYDHKPNMSYTLGFFSHGIKVAKAYGHIANKILGDWSVGAETLLMLEADWEELPYAGGIRKAYMHGVMDLLAANASWSFLRFGYNPRWQDTNGGACRPACNCAREQFSGICRVHSTGNTSAFHHRHDGCFMGSTVAFAAHRRALPFFGADHTAIDVEMQASVHDVHYVVPGVVRQRSTKGDDEDDRRTEEHVENMRGFAQHCVQSEFVRALNATRLNAQISAGGRRVP